MGEIKTNWKLSDLKPVSGDVEYFSVKPKDPNLIYEVRLQKGLVFGIDIWTFLREKLYQFDALHILSEDEMMKMGIKNPEKYGIVMIECTSDNIARNTSDEWYCADGKEKEE